MAIPTQPTAALIVAEAFNLLGKSSPTAAETTRATDYGIESVKGDIWNLSKKWKRLLKTGYDITSEGISKYSFPSDFESLYGNVVLLDGDHTGTISSGGANPTLAAAEDAAVDDVEGNLLLITSGTGVDQAVQVDGYSTTTKVATMAEAWTTNPATSDTYMIVNKFKKLFEEPMFNRNDHYNPGTKLEPNTFHCFGDSSYGYIQLYPVPDDTYGLQFEYYANLLRIDLTSTLYSTLLRQWQRVFTQGVYVWLLGQYDDNKYQIEDAKYRALLSDLRAREGDILTQSSNLQMRVIE